jgi:hypothetical protein
MLATARTINCVTFAYRIILNYLTERNALLFCGKIARVNKWQEESEVRGKKPPQWAASKRLTA